MSESTQFIERCPHDKENPYAQISRDLIRDENLTPQTRWLLIYLLSMKDGWKISVAQVANHLKGHYGCSKDKIYDWIKEAIEVGYMAKVPYFDKGLKRERFILSESPKFKKCLPDRESPDLENPSPEFADHKKEHHISKDIFNKKESVAAPSVSNFTYHKIMMTLEKHRKLIEDYGEERVKAKIEALHEYSELKAKKFREYTDHAKVIRNWINRELQDEPKKPTIEPNRKSSVSWKGKKIL